MITLTPLDRENNHMYYRRWRNDERVYKWCRQVGLISREDQDEWFDRQRKDSSIKMFQINYDPGPSGTKKPVGVCGLTSIDFINSRAEFSLYIGPEHHGKGYGKQALLGLLGIGFNTLKLNRIWGEVFNGNPALNTFKSLGFVEEGVRREFYFKEGSFINATLVSISKEEVVWDS